MVGEDVDGGDAAEVAPVVTVGGGTQSGIVVEDVLSGEELRPVGQYDVVLGEALLDQGRRGHHHDEAVTEPEGEYVSVGSGESREGSVHGWLEVVEVANDG